MKKINWQYASGEILIVIIGITVAFSINKWSENSKNEKLKSQYFVNLKNDVEADKFHLEKNLKDIQNKYDMASEILPVLGSDSPNKMSITEKIFRISTITNFYPKDITYQTLINSGDLNLFENFETKTAIETHYSNYKIMLKDYERQENIHSKYLGDYFIKNIDYDDFKKGAFGFKDEKLLKNIVQSMRGSFGLKIEATKKGIASCDSLLIVINRELP